MGGSGGKFESVDVVCCEALPVKEAENLVQEESKPVPNLELLLLQQKCCFQLRSWGCTFNPNERGAHVGWPGC